MDEMGGRGCFFERVCRCCFVDDVVHTVTVLQMLMMSWFTAMNDSVVPYRIYVVVTEADVCLMVIVLWCRCRVRACEVYQHET